MNTERNGTLPAPHQHIEVSVTTCRLTYFTVDYIARPQELLAAGLVTAFMEQKILHQRSGMQLDESYRRFRIIPITQHHLTTKRVLWSSQEPIQLRYYNVSYNAVLTLPGVRELYPEGLPTQEECDADIRANPGPGDRVCGSLSAQACAYAEIMGRVVSRARAIGHRQRLMRWSVIADTVIAPDWAWMIKERLTG